MVAWINGAWQWTEGTKRAKNIMSGSGAMSGYKKSAGAWAGGKSYRNGAVSGSHRNRSERGAAILSLTLRSHALVVGGWPGVENGGCGASRDAPLRWKPRTYLLGLLLNATRWKPVDTMEKINWQHVRKPLWSSRMRSASRSQFPNLPASEPQRHNVAVQTRSERYALSLL